MLNANADLLELKRRLKDSLKREQGKIHQGSGANLFLILGNEEKILLDREFAHCVLAADRVQAIVRLNSEGQKVCEPEKLIGKPKEVLVAKLMRRGDAWFASPIGSPWIRWPIDGAQIAALSKTHPLKENDWVQVEILEHPLAESEKESSEKRKGVWKLKLGAWIGSKDDPFLSWRHELIKAGLPSENPFESFDFAPKIKALETEALPRVDYTGLSWWTVDAPLARDSDDAIFARECDEKSYEIFIAITDVDAWVKPQSEMDRFAQELSATIYLPGYTMPMFPKALSEKHASLVKNEKRAAIVCRVLCDKQTHQSLQEPCFELAWIRIEKKWSYIELEESLASLKQDAASPLALLWSFSQRQLFERFKRLSVLVERKEYEYVLDQAGKVHSIVSKPRLKSERLIESLMIFANQSFASLSATRVLQGTLYTIQEGFSHQKLDLLQEELVECGVNIDRSELNSQEGFWRIQNFLQRYSPLAESAKKTLYHASAAELSLKALPHRALSLQHYATWTSPLRKYSDLVNLRILKASILNAALPEPLALEKIAQLNSQKRKIRLCQNALHMRLSTNYLKELLVHSASKSKIFPARVSSVVKRGLMLFIEALNLEVFLPFAELNHALQTSLSLSAIPGRCISDSRNKKYFVLGKLLVISLDLKGIQKPYCLARYLSGFEEAKGLKKSFTNPTLKKSEALEKKAVPPA